MTTSMKKFGGSLAVLLLAFALSACTSPQEADTPEPLTTSNTNAEYTVKTLTFHGSNLHGAVAEQAAEAMNQAWQAQGRPYTFELVIDTFSYRNWQGEEARFTRLITQLMAGEGPDIFVYDWQYDVHALARSGFLKDFNVLIEGTGRDQFFTSPLNAFEMYGGLYMFPTNFCYQYVAINATLPQSIIDAFTQSQFVTMGQLMDIYLQLIRDYPAEFGHMHFAIANAFGGAQGAQTIMNSAMGDFIDFTAQTSDLLNPQFIAFLDKMGQVGHGQRHLVRRVGGFIGHEIQQDYIDSYVFAIHSHGSNHAHMAHNFLTPHEPLFYHNRILVDNNNNLKLSMPMGGGIWSALGVTAAGNYTLAWEFIQHLIYAYTHPNEAASGTWGTEFGSHYLGSPIIRDLFEAHTAAAFQRHLDANFTINASWRNANLYVGTEDPAPIINAAIQRIAAYNEMPMTMVSPMIPSSLFADNIELFFDNVIGSEEFAQRTHNAIMLWFME